MKSGGLPPGIIINADDLGIHPRINAGIVSAYRHGVLTSSTMLLTTPYLEETVREIVRPGLLPVGLHLSLTLGKAVAPLADVPDLVDEEGYFKHSAGRLIVRSFSDDKGRLLFEQVRRELTAQLALAHDWGIRPTHLDSHQHVHMNPAIFRICEAEARRFGVTRMRVCHEPFPWFALHLEISKVLRRRNHAKWALIRWVSRAIDPHVATSDRFFGTVYSGIMLKRVLRALLQRTSSQQSLEIGIHPGFPVPPQELSRSERGFADFISSPLRQNEHDALIDNEIAALIRRQGLQPRAYDGALKLTE